MKNLANQMSKVLAIVILSIFIVSCASREDVVYFSKVDDQMISSKATNYSPKLIPDDLIEITVAAIDMQAVGPFNGLGVNEGVDGAVAKSYLIDYDGKIEFPIIGEVKLAGLTRLEATELLKEKIAVYVNNPIVNIQIVNFKVTVLGEVNKPGTFEVENERVTIMQALGLAGDMTIYGERSNVLVIREIDGKKTYTRIDLTTDEVFNSSVYYLAQNDVVYIEPNGSRINQSKSNLTGIILPITGSLLAIATTIAIINNN